MIESIMLPRFSVPSRRQWKPYNDTMRIYVYKTQPELARLFPSPTYLPGSPPSGNVVFESRFLFKGKDPSNHRQSLFLARYEGKTVLIKFCEWYSETALRLLASVGLAPVLHFCSKMDRAMNRPLNGAEWRPSEPTIDRPFFHFPPLVAIFGSAYASNTPSFCLALFKSRERLYMYKEANPFSL